MPRSLRLQYPGAYYHVMARGNRREAIFHDDDDRRFFLKAVSEACEMTGWRVHAWVLMGNHYHLFIQTPEANLVAGMSWLQNTYTRRYNVRHRAWGRVFGDRYKAVVVEGEDRYHYQTLMDYIHLNPVRAKRMQAGKKAQSALDYPWSSLAGGYALPPKRRAKWLAAEAGLKAFDLADTVAGRRRMVERVDERAVKEGVKNCGVPALPEAMDARCSHLRRGWYWGCQAFGEKLQRLAQAMLKVKVPRARADKHAPQQRAHGLECAERHLKEGLKAAGLKVTELDQLKGSDPRKLALAELLWKRTVVSQEWLAEKLRMKSAANVGQQLRRLDKKGMKTKLPHELVEYLQQQNEP